MVITSEKPLLSRLTGEFTSVSQEKLFRDSTEQERSVRLRFIWAIASLFFLGFGLVDFLLIENYYLLGLRFGIFIIGVVVIGLTYTRISTVIFDIFLFFALGIVSLLYAYLTFLRVELAPYQPGSAVILSMGFYLFSPNRFLLTCINSLFCSLVIATASQGDTLAPVSHYIQSNIYLLPANILAASSLLQINVIRRTNFIQQKQLESEVELRRKAQLGLSAENKRSQLLLLNMLPRHIVERIGKNKEDFIADNYSNTTVLVMDIADFAYLSSKLEVKRLVSLLDTIHASIERLAQLHGVEKIKATGNSFMLVAGIPTEVKQHAVICAEMAISVLEEVGKIAMLHNVSLQMRIGIHSGALTAGVIGRRKLCYDVWGNTVINAGTLAAKCKRGEIKLSDSTHQLLKDKFIFSKSLPFQIEGGSVQEAWVLKGWKDIITVESHGNFILNK